MTGAFVRIRRDGWQNVEIDELTDAELEKFKSEHPDDGWKWAIFLAKWIRDNVGDSEAQRLRDQMENDAI